MRIVLLPEFHSPLLDARAPHSRQARSVLPEELARVIERARFCGRTPARFIRETALSAIPKSRHHIDRDALLQELARIGRELARLATVREVGTDVAARDDIGLAQTLSAHRAALRAIVEDAAKSRAA